MLLEKVKVFFTPLFLGGWYIFEGAYQMDAIRKSRFLTEIWQIQVGKAQ